MSREHVRRLRRHLDSLSTRLGDAAVRHPHVVRMGAASVVATIVVSVWFLYQVLSGLPGRDALRQLAESAEGTTVYDAFDRPVFSIPTQYRIEVPLSAISRHLRHAIVAVEDVRFYEHDGIDAVRILGAVLTDIRKGRAAEGASTITQQLARVSFLTRDKTLRRKVREAILAQRIERMYTKNDILEIYLNKVYFGDGLYGAEAASRGYFGKPASELSLGEAAMLAGLVKAPSATNPTVSVERAVARRNLVLKLMREHRFIAQAEFDRAMSEHAALHDNLRREAPAGLHFREVVRRELIERFGKETVYTGRLQVYATIDMEMQKAAELAVRQTLAEIEGRVAAKRSEPLQASLLALDPATGEVRAIVGGRDTAATGLNRALQTKRQAGSAFKPFIFAVAIENGLAPASIVDRLDEPVDTDEGAWLPEDEHSTAASMTLRAALRTSSNRAAVRVLERVGIDRAVESARSLGIGALPNVPSLALGSGEVTLAAMTAGYAAFANEGMVQAPSFIRRVEDQDGTVVLRNDAEPRRAFSKSTAFLMATMLADVIDHGTANTARKVGFTSPAAGKTGTTNDFVDAWFIGFTPRLVAGVWVGFDKPRTIVKNGFAGRLAVPMWAKFMKAATGNDGGQWFTPPPDVIRAEVCKTSGYLPGPFCRHAASISETGEIVYKSMVYVDYFVRGTEPHRTCAGHMDDLLPYPEPHFAFSAFDDVQPVLAVEPVIPAPPPPAP